jgi:hypothetical protein
MPFVKFTKICTRTAFEAPHAHWYGMLIGENRSDVLWVNAMKEAEKDCHAL